MAESKLNEKHSELKMLYTFFMSRAAGVLRGYGSLLQIIVPKAAPPYLEHHFYSSPSGSALDSLRKDWQVVTAEMLAVAKREIENAEAASCTFGR